MKKLTFAVVGAFSLAIAACGGTEDDTVDVEENFQTEELNMLAENAAMDAEAEALGNEVDATTNETTDEATPVDENVTDPSRVEEDVQGM